LKNVKEIVKKYLDDNGFTGLYDEHGECGCEINDLAPCSEMRESCCAGYKVDCTEECEHELGWTECLWHIQKDKPEDK